MMSITIADIAKDCGVSVSTVSRVINKTKAVRPELALKIQTSIEKHNYTPNTVARSLVTSKTYTIGVIIGNITNCVFGEIIKGINHVAWDEGYTTLVMESHGSFQRKKHCCKHWKRDEQMAFCWQPLQSMMNF